MFYLPADEPAQVANPPQFASDREAAVAALEKPPGKMDCAPFWDCLRAAVQATSALSRGIRHLIVHNQSSDTAPPDMAEIVSASIASNTSVQVVSLTPSAPLEELCRRTRGSFHLAEAQHKISQLIEEALLSLAPRYLVSYAATPGARELNIRVHNSEGWGETNVPLL
jgi:hypothetical protein